MSFLFTSMTNSFSVLFTSSYGKLHENDREPRSQVTVNLLAPSVFPQTAVSLSVGLLGMFSFGLYAMALRKNCLMLIIAARHTRSHSVQMDDISRPSILMAGSEYGMHGQANFWTNGKVIQGMDVV